MFWRGQCYVYIIIYMRYNSYVTIHLSVFVYITQSIAIGSWRLWGPPQAKQETGELIRIRKVGQLGGDWTDWSPDSQLREPSINGSTWPVFVLVCVFFGCCWGVEVAYCKWPILAWQWLGYQQNLKVCLSYWEIWLQVGQGKTVLDHGWYLCICGWVILRKTRGCVTWIPPKLPCFKALGELIMTRLVFPSCFSAPNQELLEGVSLISWLFWTVGACAFGMWAILRDLAAASRDSQNHKKSGCAVAAEAAEGIFHTMIFKHVELPIYANFYQSCSFPPSSSSLVCFFGPTLCFTLILGKEWLSLVLFTQANSQLQPRAPGGGRAQDHRHWHSEGSGTSWGLRCLGRKKKQWETHGNGPCFLVSIHDLRDLRWGNDLTFEMVHFLYLCRGLDREMEGVTTSGLRNSR